MAAFVLDYESAKEIAELTAKYVHSMDDFGGACVKAIKTAPIEGGKQAEEVQEFGDQVDKTFKGVMEALESYLTSMNNYASTVEGFDAKKIVANTTAELASLRKIEANESKKKEDMGI